MNVQHYTRVLKNRWLAIQTNKQKMGKRDKSKLAKNATKNIYNKDQRF